MGRIHGKLAPGIRYFVGASLLLACLGLAAWAGALLPPERFSNFGSLSGDPDGLVPGGDRHNTYAWSMESMKNSAGYEYLYVGSNRDMGYLVLSSNGMSGDEIMALSGGDLVPPDGGDLRGRIFRKRTDGTGDWEIVYTSEMIPGTPYPFDMGYRGAVSYAAPGEAGPSLYFGSMGFVSTRLLKITPDFEPGGIPETVFQTEPGASASLRPMTVYDGDDGDKLYIGVLKANDDPSLADIQILESTHPSMDPGAWKQVAFLSDFPGARTTTAAVASGGVWDMVSFNGWLYAFIGSFYTGADDDGFMVFKGKPVPEGTYGRNAAGWRWVPVVAMAAGAKYPNGAGNPSNIAPTPFPYSVDGKDYVYVGTCADLPTAISMVTRGGSVTDFFRALYPVQVYRFDGDDNWEMVIGNPQDSRGVFTERLGNFGAGFFNAPEAVADLPAVFSSPRELSMNQYQWRMGVYKGKLYVTTMDANVLLDYAKNIAPEEQKAAVELLIEAFRDYNPNPLGFDLYSTGDGVSFTPVTTNGFGDKYNYGGRTLKATGNGIFIGTANPFYGCQVWKLAEEEEEEPVVSGGSGGCSAAGSTPFALLLALPLLLLKR